jgi:hypothetical protein
MLPSPETIRDNVILALPKLVEGMLVTSEFVDRGGNPDSYFEEYVAKVVAILSVEQQQRLESTDGQKVVLKYELTFGAERRYFSWNFLTDGRLPPRGEWRWKHDDGHFYRVILCAEIVAENHNSPLLNTVSVAEIESLGNCSWDLDDLAESAYTHVESLLNRIERPKTPVPGNETVFRHQP